MKKQFIGKFQKILAVIVAATMLLATMVSAIPVLADTATGYTGQMLGFYTHKYPATLKVDSIEHNVSNFANGVTTSVLSYVSASADITPENYATGISTGVVYYDETDTEALASAVEISETSAFMFYIKLPASMPETKVVLSGQTYAEDGGSAGYPILWGNDNDTYILSSDSPVWETVKTVRFGVENSGVPNAAAVTLPSGFEGWVRVPFANFRVSDWTLNKLYRMNFYLDHYSATEPFYYGAFMVVDNPTENLTTLTLGDETVNLTEKAAYNSDALDLGEFTSNKYYSMNENAGSIAQTAVLFDNENGKNFELSVGEDFSGNGYASDYYTAEFANQVLANALIRPSGSGWATPEWLDILNGFVDTNAFVFSSEASVTIPEDQTYSSGMIFKDASSNVQNLTWDSNRSVIFYVENSGIKANKFSFLFEGTGVYSHLVENQTYYLLANGSTEWKSNTTAIAYDGSWGYIDVPAGFAGYVRIPCSAHLSNGNYVQTGTISKVYVYPRNIGGDYGAFTVGAFGTVDKTTENLMYIASAATENEPVVMAQSTVNSVNRTEPTGVIENGRKDAVTWEGNTVTAANLNDTTLYTSSLIGMRLNSAPISANGSVMFYVESTSDSVVTGGVFTEEWYCTWYGDNYYLLGDGSSAWVEKTIPSGSGNNGYIEIPANYKGWVRIPVTSFRADIGGKTELTYLGFSPMVLNGSLTFSNIMTTDANNNGLYINDGKIAGLSDISNSFDAEIDFNVAISSGNITTDATIGALNVSADVLSETVIGADGSLMFYAKAQNAAKFALGLSDANSLKDSFTYYTVDYNSLWAENTVTDGLISVEAGFEGWVRIPASAFASTDISKVIISFVNATEGIAVSDFMVTDKATYELDYIVINGKKVSLFVELYDANADGEIDARDIVRLKKFVAQVEGINVPALAGDIDRSSDIDITDISILRNGLLNGFEDSTGEVALSRYLSEQGLTTSANYTSATATVNNVNF